MRIILATLLTLGVAATAVADDLPTARYFAGLRQRGMLDLAEGEALRRLAAPATDENEQLTLVAELARTFAEHAKYAEGREQADLWKRAESLLSEFLQDHPTLPSSVELEVLQGELALSCAARRFAGSLNCCRNTPHFDKRRFHPSPTQLIGSRRLNDSWRNAYEIGIAAALRASNR